MFSKYGHNWNKEDLLRKGIFKFSYEAHLLQELELMIIQDDYSII